MKTIKKVEITPVWVDTVPNELEQNKMYISEKYGVAIHLCLCGCGEESVLPFYISDDADNFDKKHGWKLIKEKEDKITLTPSIGNFRGENPYHAHYIITKNVANFV